MLHYLLIVIYPTFFLDMFIQGIFLLEFQTHSHTHTHSHAHSLTHMMYHLWTVLHLCLFLICSFCMCCIFVALILYVLQVCGAFFLCLFLICCVACSRHSFRMCYKFVAHFILVYSLFARWMYVFYCNFKHTHTHTHILTHTLIHTHDDSPFGCNSSF